MISSALQNSLCMEPGEFPSTGAGCRSLSEPVTVGGRESSSFRPGRFPGLKTDIHINQFVSCLLVVLLM